MTVNVELQIPDALYLLQFLPTNMKLDFVNVSFTEKPSKSSKLVKISTLTKFCADLAVNIKTLGGRVAGLSPKTQNIASWYNINVREAVSFKHLYRLKTYLGSNQPQDSKHLPHGVTAGEDYRSRDLQIGQPQHLHEKLAQGSELIKNPPS